MNKIEIEDILADLRSVFFRRPEYRDLSDQFDRLLHRRRAEMRKGGMREARGIALIGPSGSGKTTAVDRLFEKHGDLKLPTADALQTDIISFQVPSPATLKDVGMAALAALGYPLERDKPAGIIWERVRHYLRLRETLFLHIDEAQDLYTAKSENALQSVINTLKSLMQNKEWPVGIVLSGMPKVKPMLNYDPQLARRFYPIELRRVSGLTNEQMLTNLLGSYADKARLNLAERTTESIFMERLAHSGAGEFGLIVEIVISAIEEALHDASQHLDDRHFIRAFRRRTGCIEGLNPFVVPDFTSIDPRQLLGNGQTDPNLLDPKR